MADSFGNRRPSATETPCWEREIADLKLKLAAAEENAAEQRRLRMGNAELIGIAKEEAAYWRSRALAAERALDGRQR